MKLNVLKRALVLTALGASMATAAFCSAKWSCHDSTTRYGCCD